jgi:enoyl-CoA hydratase/carnithine racemase
MFEDMGEILFSELSGKNGNIGEITLNRPKALNALTTNMCYQLRTQLIEWQQNSRIKAVIIRGAGDRAFCAGGDIRALYADGKENQDAAVDFFRHEYAMNREIFHFTKPYISFLHGITMGGGAGVSIHGSHRVTNEQLIFAMPETGIGFFPDIGAGCFLSRLENKMGYYLGLTGDRIGAADAKWLGLVTHIIPPEKQNDAIAALTDTEFSADAKKQVSQILDAFAVKPSTPRLSEYQQQITDCFSAESVEEVMLRLEENNSEWSLAVTKTLLTKSPISLKVTFEQLKRSEQMKFDEIMQMEFNIALQFLHTADFFEGVRAAVIDKDQNPQWNPPLLDEVSQAHVAAFFSFKEKLI